MYLNKVHSEPRLKNIYIYLSTIISLTCSNIKVPKVDALILEHVSEIMTDTCNISTHQENKSAVEFKK